MVRTRNAQTGCFPGKNMGGLRGEFINPLNLNQVMLAEGFGRVRAAQAPVLHVQFKIAN